VRFAVWRMIPAKGLTAVRKTQVSFSRSPKRKGPQGVMQENDQRQGEPAKSLKSSFSWSLLRGEEKLLPRISDCDPLSHSEGATGAGHRRKFEQHSRSWLCGFRHFRGSIRCVTVENSRGQVKLCIERECNKNAQARVPVLLKAFPQTLQIETFSPC
jgi:hypothetical protein